MEKRSLSPLISVFSPPFTNYIVGVHTNLLLHGSVSWFYVSLLTMCLFDYLIAVDVCWRMGTVRVPEWAIPADVISVLFFDHVISTE